MNAQLEDTENFAMPLTIMSGNRRVPLEDKDRFIGSVQGTDELNNHLVLCEVYVSAGAVVMEGVRYKGQQAQDLSTYLCRAVGVITAVPVPPPLAALERIQMKWEEYQRICEQTAAKHRNYALDVEATNVLLAEITQQFRADLAELQKALGV